MALTHEWQEYDMDYQKAVQDIRTKDGMEYLNCWPNAGKFNVMAEERKDCVQIPEAEVSHVRLNKSWMTDGQQSAGEAKPLKLTPVSIIGHIDHGLSASVLMAHEILTAQRDRGIVIIDDTPPPPKEVFILENPYANTPDIPGMFLGKTRKPNKGFQIGSYKFKSKKKAK